MFGKEDVYHSASNKELVVIVADLDVINWAEKLLREKMIYVTIIENLLNSH